MNEIARLLAAQRAPTIVRGEEGYVLMCAVCGESAVAFRSQKSRLSAQSISKVNVTTFWEGETGQRLAELLAEGKGRAVLNYFASPNGGRRGTAYNGLNHTHFGGAAGLAI